VNTIATAAMEASAANDRRRDHYYPGYYFTMTSTIISGGEREALCWQRIGAPVLRSILAGS